MDSPNFSILLARKRGKNCGSDRSLVWDLKPDPGRTCKDNLPVRCLMLKIFGAYLDNSQVPGRMAKPADAGDHPAAPKYGEGTAAAN